MNVRCRLFVKSQRAQIVLFASHVKQTIPRTIDLAAYISQTIASFAKSNLHQISPSSDNRQSSPRANQEPQTQTRSTMCYRTNYSFSCGHTDEVWTKCRAPQSSIIPKRCLATIQAARDEGRSRKMSRLLDQRDQRRSRGQGEEGAGAV